MDRVDERVLVCGVRDERERIEQRKACVLGVGFILLFYIFWDYGSEDFKSVIWEADDICIWVLLKSFQGR